MKLNLTAIILPQRLRVSLYTGKASSTEFPDVNIVQTASITRLKTSEYRNPWHSDDDCSINPPTEANQSYSVSFVHVFTRISDGESNLQVAGHRLQVIVSPIQKVS